MNLDSKKDRDPAPFHFATNVFFKDTSGRLMVMADPRTMDIVQSVVERLNGPESVLLGAAPTNLVTRVFKVDPKTFIEGLKNVAGLDTTEFSVGDEKQTGLPNEIGIGSRLPVARMNAVSKAADMVRDFFKAAGVNMDPPKQVFFNDRNGVLMVRADARDMGIIKAAVEILGVPPPMVTIEAKWVEITVDPDDPDAMAALRKRVAEIAPNLDLSRVAGPLPGQNLPLVNPFTSNLIDQGIITNAPPSDRLSGILSPEQFRAAIQLFEMTDGVDVLSTPRVTTLSGRQAQVAVIDLATIPKGPVGGTNVYSVPLGPTLDVLPYVDSRKGSVRMTLIPNITEFLGFADPDEVLPRKLSAERRKRNRQRERQGEAPVINALPRFRVRSTIAHGVVADGHTMVLGGMVVEDSKEVRKKTLAGRLLGAKTTKKERKCLLIFVTPTIVDPAGNRVKGSKSVGTVPPLPAWIEADLKSRGGW